MNCPKCLKEATPDCVQFRKGTRYICEHCGKVFTDYGQASENELEKLREQHFQQAVTMQRYKPFRMTVGEKLQQNNVKLTNPNWRNVKTGTLRARS